MGPVPLRPYPRVMRFLFLAPAFSADGSKAHLFQQMAEELASRGHTADVISMGMSGAMPAGPQPGTTERLRVFTLGTPPLWAPKKGSLKYAPNLWRLNLNRSLRDWLNGPYDGFLLATPGVMSAGVGQKLKRSGVVKKVAFVLWDFFPIAQTEAGALRLGPAKGLAYGMERRVAAASDVLLAMSPAGAEFAKSYYRLPDARTAILPPWGRPVSSTENSLEKYSRFTCVWGGQFIARRAIPDILKSAQLLEQQGVDVDFRLAGDGPLLEESRLAAGDLGLSTVHFEGRLTREDYFSLLKRSHVALSVIEPGSSPTFPSKTVDYCQAGLPLVASVEACTDYGRIMADTGAGIAVNAGDTIAIASAISHLANAPQTTLDVMSRASRQFFEEQLQVSVAATKIEEVLSNET